MANQKTDLLVYKNKHINDNNVNDNLMYKVAGVAIVGLSWIE